MSLRGQQRKTVKVPQIQFFDDKVAVQFPVRGQGHGGPSVGATTVVVARWGAVH